MTHVRQLPVLLRSGHGAMRENYYLDDGTYSASQIVILMAQRALEGRGRDVAGDLLQQLPEAVEAREFRLKLQARALMSICGVPYPKPTLTLPISTSEHPTDAQCALGLC